MSEDDTFAPSAPSVLDQDRLTVETLVAKVLAAARQGGDSLFFSSVAWELGHDLVDRQEYALAAECFRRLLSSAADANDDFLAGAARAAGQLCTALSHEQPVGEELHKAREALRRDLLRLTYKDVHTATLALTAGSGGRVSNRRHGPAGNADRSSEEKRGKETRNG